MGLCPVWDRQLETNKKIRLKSRGEEGCGQDAVNRTARDGKQEMHKKKEYCIQSPILEGATGFDLDCPLSTIQSC